MIRLINVCAWCIVVLWLFCDVAFGKELERRDVHRIIIREEVPSRSRSNHHRSRDHPRTQYESYEKNREREHHPEPTRKPKKHHVKPPISEEDYLEAYNSDWKPVVSRNNKFTRPSQSNRNVVNKNRDVSIETSSSEPTRLHELVDLTTAFSSKKAIPSVYKNNLNRVNHMNYFNYKIKQNVIDSNVAEESRPKVSIKRPVKKQVETKNIDGGYQVHENLDEDIRPPKPTSFNALSPSVVRSVPLYPPLPFEDNQIREEPSEASQEIVPNVADEETYGKRVKPAKVKSS